MSRITSYDPMANQAFSQAASQAAQFVNAGADNQRADQQLALRQNAQQFEQELIRNANRDRLLREAKRNEANKAIFDLLKAETPNGDIGLMSQFVGLGAARGLPTMEQGIQSQVQGMAQAAQQDGFERLLRERPDAIENASPALVELLRDRGSKASATRLAEVNARIAGLERRGLAPYAKQMIDEARGLGLDMKDSLLPVRDRIEGKQQQDADKQFMLVERGFQPGTPEWEREMQRSYKFSTDLYKAHVERQAQQQAAQQAAAEQAQQTQLGGMIQSGPAGMAAAMNPNNGPPITLANADARAQYVASAGPQFDARQFGMIAGDAGLRTMYNNAGKSMAAMGEQIMQPTMGERVNDAKQVAQLAAIANDQRRPFEERFAAAAQLKDAGYETASGMPTTGTVDQLPFLRKRVDDRKQEYEYALAAAKAAGIINKDGVIAEPMGTSDNPSTPNDPKRAAYATFVQAKRNYERSMADVRNAEQSTLVRQTEPMLMSERDAQIGIGSAAASMGIAPEQDQQVDAAVDAWEKANGRPPGSATPQEVDQIIASLGGGLATPR